MPILDQYGNPVSSGGGRHFSNSANRSDRSHPSEPIYTDDFDKLIPDWDRKTLVSGSRKMYQNFPPASGAINDKADNVIGRAWDPIFKGEDKEWGKIAGDWLREQWYEISDVKGMGFKKCLWLDSVAIDRDGDFLIVLESTRSGYPMTRRISANRIGQRNSYNAKVEKGKYKGREMRQGVVLDKRGVALGYNILGDTYKEDLILDASQCIFVNDPNWHDQTRGVPSLSGALKFIRSSLLSHEWEQMAQLMVSSIGLVEYNEYGGPDQDDPTTTQSTVDGAEGLVAESLQGGTVRYIKSNSGGKIEQIKHDRPNDMWESFNDRVIRMMSKSVDWPYELSWKSDKINSALVRSIQDQARITVDTRQDMLKTPALKQIRWAIAKAMKEGIIPRPKTEGDWWRWNFNMPRKFSIDASKEAQQRREDYKIGFKNKGDVITEEGRNEEEMENERIDAIFRYENKIRDREKLEGYKVERRKFEMLTPNDMAVAEPEEEETKPKPTEEDER